MPEVYDFEAEMGFPEPISERGTLELPKYFPKRNYFECYWRLFLKKKQPESLSELFSLTPGMALRGQMSRVGLYRKRPETRIHPEFARRVSPL